MELPLHPITKRFYGNWTVHGPDGVFMFKCDAKKAKWYLSRNLAADMGGNIIQLNFTPKGSGKVEACPYFQEFRENQCVVCGAKEDLTRHHVVPKAFRSHMLDLASHDSYDVLMVCINCHEKVEHTYTDQKKILAKSIKWDRKKKSDEDRRKDRISSLIAGYQKYSSQIPMYKKAAMLEELHALTGGKIESFKDILETKNEKSSWYDDDFPYQDILAVQPDRKQFIVMWRKLFLEAAKPKFLSQSWIDCHETYFMDS